MRSNCLQIGTKVPSIIEPFRLKYQLIELSFLLSQSSAGVNPYDARSENLRRSYITPLTPDPVLRAEVRLAKVCVVDDDGVIPAFSSHVYVGSVWKIVGSQTHIYGLKKAYLE